MKSVAKIRGSLLVACYSLLLACPAFSVVGNFNADCIVDFKDFATLAANWQTSGTGDLDSDGTVDFDDLAIFVSHWLESEPATADPSKATTPDPSNHATAVAITKTLSWSMSNQGCEPTVADVWFAEYGQTLVKVAADTTSSSYSPTLEHSHQYQWRVDTKNSHGTTTGDVWDFTVAQSNAPVASDVAASAYTYVVCPITLSATDDGYPSPPAKLRYIITALPADANAYVQDPVSGGQIRIRTSDLPYKLSTWGKVVWFATDTTGTPHFHYKAYDGEQYSDEKTVTVTVSANPKDCLSFDGQGWVTIPDTGDKFDLVTVDGDGTPWGNMICFFIKTRTAYCGILKKHEAGKAGYEVGLVGGKITVRMYNSSNEVVSQNQSSRRYDDGRWTHVGMLYCPIDNCLELIIWYGNEPTTGGYTAYEDLTEDSGLASSVPTGTYINDCNFVVGKNNDIGYKWEITNIRVYNMQNDSMFRAINASQRRATAGNAETLAPPAANVRFKCIYDGTNNTTTQIYDDKAAHLIGTFSSSAHVRYLPWVWQWWDAAALIGNY